MGDEVRVEPGQLRAKADDVAAPVNDVSAAPTAPCALTFVQSATAQVRAGADTLKNFMTSGNRAASNLATVLRTAADVYQRVDDRARYALDHDPPLPVPGDAVPVNPPLEPPIPAIEEPPIMNSMPGGDTGGYVDPKAAAQIIHSGNSGPMRTYATDARDFANSLRAAADRYSLAGVTWGGDAADSAGNALRQHQNWLHKVAEQYDYLATQADDLAAAQDKWAAQHPTVEEIEQAEQAMQQAIQNRDRVALHIAQDKYAELVRKSDEVLVSYSAGVTGKGLLGVPKPPAGTAPIPPVSGNGDPRRPDQPRQHDAKKDGSPQPGTGDGTGAPQQPTAVPSPSAQPTSAQRPAAQQAAGGAPADGGAPSGGMPGGLPGGGSSTAKPRLPTEPSLKPAALGGGGAGGGAAGGGGGAPSMPLSPAVGAETVAPTAPAHAATAATGAAVYGGAAGGAMGGGMAPMHGAGLNNQGKEKRRDPNLSPDEDLYTEDRPWTEAVIGNRRRRDVQDKESK
jgi:ESX-1 secreted protein B PE domain/Excreted virulence factor EspC, type VII ESX diderm